MEFAPVRSALQTFAGDPIAPEWYASNGHGPLSALQIAFDWQVTNLARFHQIMCADLQRRDARIGEEHSRLKEVVAQFNSTDAEEIEGFNLMLSRHRNRIMEADDDVVRTKHLADEYTVIGLWATAEQYLGKVFIPFAAHMRGVTLASVTAPYRWDDICAAFRPLGIELTTLRDFPDADECRVLNNTIKHAGYVDVRLVRYSFFSSHLNAKLSGLDLPLQRYVNGVTHLIGSLIQEASQIMDPSFRP